MPCAERQKLLGLFLEAGRVRNDAVRAMNGCDGEALGRLAALAKTARQTYKDCREVLESHERAHGCAPKD